MTFVSPDIIRNPRSMAPGVPAGPSSSSKFGRSDAAASVPGRLPGVDAWRFLGVVAVILIHTTVANPLGFGIDDAKLLDQSCRWAVPYFFLASGYFFGSRPIGAAWPAIRVVALRIGLPFLAWSLLYILVSKGGPSRLLQPDFVYRWLLTGGPGWHLWFLPSLLICLVALILMDRGKLVPESILAVALVVYALGLVLGPYHSLLDGIATHGAAFQERPPLLDGRGGPFPLAFVATGFWLRRRDVRVSAAMGAALFLVGAALHLAEAAYLDGVGAFPFAHNDLLAGTLPFGAGAFLLALRVPGGPVVSRLARLGSLGLGLYAAHLLFVIPMRRAFPPVDLATGLLSALLVLVATVLLVATLAQVRFLRPVLA